MFLRASGFKNRISVNEGSPGDHSLHGFLSQTTIP